MAHDLKDVLDLTPAAAREQWRAIRARAWPQGGKRQEKFLPVEIILCMGLFDICRPNRYGGGNILSAPAPLRTLADTFKRSPGSLTSKMLNLDGSRANAGRFETDVFAELSSNRDQLVALVQRALWAAGREGFTEAQVPDFMGIHQGVPELLGQDEIGPREFAIALKEEKKLVQTLEKQFKYRDHETMRLVEQRIRIGQHHFARDVLAAYDHTCGFCGFSPRSLPGSKLLVASHIKPWRDGTNAERLDVHNGVAACPTHDAAFDTGLLAIQPGFKVVRHEALQRAIEHDRGMERYFGADALRPMLYIPDGFRGPGTPYLQHHLAEVFGQRSQPPPR